MKQFKILMFAAYVIGATALLCSCSSRQKISSNLKNVDLSGRGNIFQSSVNNDKGINPAGVGDGTIDDIMESGENGQQANYDKFSEAVKLDGDSKNNSQAGGNKPAGESLVTAGSSNNTATEQKPSGSSSSGKNDKEGSSGSSGKSSYTIGDVTITTDENLSEDEVNQAVDNIRELEEAVADEFMGYMPLFTNKIIRINTSKYGVTVTTATKADFGVYADRLIKKGFTIISKNDSDKCIFEAKTNKDMFAKITTDANGRLLISVYNDVKHFD